jgi:protein tyrosine/serine phosphatase
MKRGVGVLTGAYNFRDLGGTRTRDGGLLRHGRLFRSDTLQELTEEDVARLVDELKIAFVVDLRQAAEAVEEGRGPLARLPACYANVPLVDIDSPAGAPGELTVTQYLDHLEHDPNLVVAVELVASVVHRPTVLHCAAGKDRTGVVVALALSAVGVRPEAIVADYAATGERTGALLGRLRRSPTYAHDINSKPQQEHAPRPDTMAAFLEQIGARHGGAGRWLADHGFGEDGLGLLRAKLLST